jgi:hypothetical protein
MQGQKKQLRHQKYFSRKRNQSLSRRILCTFRTQPGGHEIKQDSVKQN